MSAALTEIIARLKRPMDVNNAPEFACVNTAASRQRSTGSADWCRDPRREFLQSFGYLVRNVENNRAYRYNDVLPIPIVSAPPLSSPLKGSDLFAGVKKVVQHTWPGHRPGSKA